MFAACRARGGLVLVAFILVTGIEAGTRLEEIMARRRAQRDGRSLSLERGRGPSGASVEVPITRAARRGRARGLQLILDSVPDVEVESQSTAKADAYLQVGRRLETSVSFLPGGNMRRNTEESAEAIGIFLHAPAVHLHAVRFRLLSYRGQGTELQTEGVTPPIGQVEVLRVREVGDIRGESMWTGRGIRFRLGGEETRVPLDIPADPEARYLVILSVPVEEGEEAFVTLPAASEGEHRALRLDPRHGLPLEGGRRYDAAVAFEYRPDPDAVRPTTRVEGEFLEAIRRFLRENPEAETMPLRLILE